MVWRCRDQETRKEGGERQKNGKEIVGGDREGKRETKRERETGREINRESWGAGVRWGCGSREGRGCPREGSECWRERGGEASVDTGLG